MYQAAAALVTTMAESNGLTTLRDDSGASNAKCRETSAVKQHSRKIQLEGCDQLRPCPTASHQLKFAVAMTQATTSSTRDSMRSIGRKRLRTNIRSSSSFQPGTARR